MRRLLKSEDFRCDARGVALTEFCIVIPVVLIFFMSMLQYVEILQTAQLGDYAAYVAARAYSVRFKAAAQPDNYTPMQAAQDAAEMALAPAASLTPLPVPGLSSLESGLGQLLSLMGSSNAKAFGVGYTNAKLLFAFGGVFQTPKETQVGSHYEEQVAINYPQQINVPGLASLWNMLGENGQQPSLISDPEQYLQDIEAEAETGQSSASAMSVSLVKLGNQTDYELEWLTGMPYINIPCNARAGSEVWSGKQVAADSSPGPYTN